MSDGLYSPERRDIMKTIKIFDGMELETENGRTKYPDMKLFDEMNLTDNQRLDIIRHLFAWHEVDLSKAYGEKFIIRTY